MKLKLTFKILFLVLYFAVTKGQSPRFQTYQLIKNKNEVAVNTIFQDKAGFIWIGTAHEGLLKFDGIEFLQIISHEQLQNIDITAVAEDTDGTMCIGLENGKILTFSNGRLSTFEPEEGMGSETISSLFFDSDSILWFSTLGEGVYNYSGKTRKRLYNKNIDDGLPDNFVYCITEDNSHRLYFGTDKGIVVYNKKEEAFTDTISMHNGLTDNIIKHLIIRDNTLWIAMEDGGISTYNLLTKEVKNIPNLNFGSINNFCITTEGEIWISTRQQGVYRSHINTIFSGKADNFSVPDGLDSKNTLLVFADRENNVLIGSKVGLTMRKNNRIEFINTSEGIGIKDIYSLVIDKTQKIWLASASGLFTLTKNKEGKYDRQQVMNKGNLKNVSYISLFIDSLGYIWAGSYGYGIFRINPENGAYENFDTRKGLTNNNVISISGNNKYVFFSTLGGGFSYLELGNEWKINTINTTNGLSSDYVYQISVSGDSAYISTDGGGLFIFNLLNKQIGSFPYNDKDLFSRVIYGTLKDRNGRLWINTADKGIFCWQNDSLYNYNELNGLRTNAIRSLASDSEGNIYLISNEGIDIFIKNATLIQSLGDEHKIAYIEPHLNSVFKDEFNNIWIGAATNIIKYSPKNTEMALSEPVIVLTGKLVFDKEVQLTQKKFRHNQNYFTFRCAGLWIQSPEVLQYRYMLEGYDIDWSIPTTQRTISYSNLRPGKYSFRVQVSHITGYWVENTNATYSFVIRPPFWKTWWFISITLISIIALVLFYIQQKVKNLEKAKIILEEEVKKRTFEIQQQKEEIETQRDEIEAQRDFVTRQRDQIERQNKKIKSSIEYASKIQKAVLPKDNIIDKYAHEHFIFFRPRDIVSGDFYWFMERDNTLIVVAADCTGHGVPGAFMSMLGVSFLNEIVAQSNCYADKILNSLREKVKSTLAQSGNETNDGMDMSLVIIDKEKKSLQFAGAFNSLYLVRKNELIIEKADKMPIGNYLKDNVPFTSKTLDYYENDVIYMLSDGLSDQFSSETKTKLTMKRVKELFLEVNRLSMAEQKVVFENEFLKWKGTEEQIDDILLIGIRLK